MRSVRTSTWWRESLLRCGAACQDRVRSAVGMDRFGERIGIVSGGPLRSVSQNHRAGDHSQGARPGGPLMTEEAALLRQDISRLLERPVRARSDLPRRRMLPSELPEDVRTLWVAGIDQVASQTTIRAAARQMDEIRRTKRQRRVAGRLDWFERSDADCPFKQGSWVIRVNSGHPSRPALVVRVTNRRLGSYIVWTAEVPTRQRPAEV